MSSSGQIRWCLLHSTWLCCATLLTRLFLRYDCKNVKRASDTHGGTATRCPWRAPGRQSTGGKAPQGRTCANDGQRVRRGRACPQDASPDLPPPENRDRRSGPPCGGTRRTRTAGHFCTFRPMDAWSAKVLSDRMRRGRIQVVESTVVLLSPLST